MTRSTVRPLFDPADYLDDLHILIKHRGLTVRQAAAELGMSKSTAYEILRRGRAEQ